MRTTLVAGRALLLLLVGLAAAPLPCRAVSLEALAGFGSAYEYPLDPSGEPAVASSSKIALAASVAAELQGPFALVGAVRYSAMSGRVTLPKIPEAPDRRVAGRTLAASAGLRCRITQKDRPAHLYFEVAPAAVLLHTSVEDVGGQVPSVAPGRSATELAPGVLLAASLDAAVCGPWAATLEFSYLATAAFENKDAILVRSSFGGLRSRAILAGVQYAVR